MISIIIPTYNNIKELKATLGSIARQTESGFEVIVVDDGSEKIMEDSIDKGKYNFDIDFYRIEHGGAPRARNYGFSRSNGEYVLFCDADIILKNNYLEIMKKELGENSEIDFVYSDFRYGWKYFPSQEFDLGSLKKMNYINTCSMVRRGKVVKWDENLEKFQDWDFWLTIAENGGIGKYINKTMFRALVRRGVISAWMPKFFYKFDWIKTRQKRRYEKWKMVVRDKHGII